MIKLISNQFKIELVYFILLFIVNCIINDLEIYLNDLHVSWHQVSFYFFLMISNSLIITLPNIVINFIIFFIKTFLIVKLDFHYFLMPFLKIFYLILVKMNMIRLVLHVPIKFYNVFQNFFLKNHQINLKRFF